MYKRLAGLGVIAVMSASLAVAQPMRRGATTALITMRVNMLASRLNLTDSQKTQAITLFTDAHTAAAPVQTDIRAKRDELSAAVKSNNIGLIDSVAQSLGTLQGQLTGIESKAEAAFYAILTPDQKKLYDAMPPGGGMGRGMGGPGGRSGPGPIGRGVMPPQ
jgi:Spy/CpxP family protein refolding chaperone